MKNWYLSLSLRWKFQIGFFVVTMVTTIYNRILASYELGKLVDIAKTNGVSQPVVQQLQANHDAYIFNSFWESGIEFFLQFFLIGFVANLFVGPIKSLCDALKSVEQGDLTKGVTQTSRDEIGVLERSFNDMLAKLNGIMRIIDNSGKQMGQSAYQIATISHEIAEISKEEESRSEEVSGAAADMKRISGSVQEQAQEASAISERTEVQAREGIRTVKTSIDKLENTVAQVHRAEEEISDLQQSADQIHLIIDTIQAIAEQTNLLALNAAIEAARAGESGRGFAVVADEVRKLAEKTASSAGEVSSIIGGLNAKVHQVTATMQTVVEEVHGSQKNAHETASVIENMAQNVTETASANNNISKVSQEQVERLQFMGDTLDKLFATLSENSSKVETTANIGDSLFEVTEKLNDLMRGFIFDKEEPLRPPPHEKRKFPRAQNSLLINLYQNGEKVEGLVKDFSLSGVKALLNQSIDVAGDIDLELWLPYENAEKYMNQNPLKVTGKVSWQKEEGKKLMCGFEFVGMTEAQRKEIKYCFDFFHKKAVYSH